MFLFRVTFRILTCLIRPPWGIMFVIAGTIVVLGASIGKDYFADFQNESFFRQLENAKIDQKGEIARQLIRQKDSGIQLLVYGLSSKEEATALACHAALKEQLSNWKTFSNHDASPLYLLLSKLLAENLKSHSPYGLNLARDLAQQMQNDILNRGIVNQRLVSENCHKIIDAWQSRQSNPVSVANINRQPAFETTLPGAGEPQNARASGIKVPYLTVRQENTMPEGRLQQLAELQAKQPDDFLQEEKSSEKSAKPDTLPRVGFYSLHTQAVVSTDRDRILISRKEPPKELAQQQETSPFLDRRLEQIALDDLPKLPTQDLMRLLNHENWAVSKKSENLLKNRDGFQDEHIQLAMKLYHPNAGVRKSILPQLAQNDELEVANWLSELLKDPDAEVRFATAKAIRQQIPLENDSLTLLKNVMQTDSDRRIAAVARELETRISADTSPARR